MKEALGTEDHDRIKTAFEELTQASHKIAEMMYQQASQSAPGAEGPEAGPAGSPPPPPPQDDDVIDADFEEVK